MTFLQILNEVLELLRESTVSSIYETSYSKLISHFVNEAKREVEDSWNWSMLRQTVSFTTVSGTHDYTMDGITSDIAMGQRFKILSALDSTNYVTLQRINYNRLQRYYNFTVPQTNIPDAYAITSTVSGNPVISLWPIPNGAYPIKIYAVIPQGDLVDGDEATVVKVPYQPVVLGAWAKAISERGEDSSTQYAEVLSRYNKTLSELISMDTANYDEELVWVEV